jgi:tetratricopeptide (TPR) repeat protein
VETNDIRALADICHTRGNIYFSLGNRDGIVEEHARALEFARQFGSTELEVRSIGGLGDAYYMRGEMLAATRQFSECCRISEENNFVEYDAANRAMIGWSRIYELEFTAARDDALKGVELTRKCGNFRGEINSRSLLGFVYAELMEPELSKEHADIASEMAAKIGSFNYRAAVLVFSNRNLDEHTQREEMYEQASEAVESIRQYGHSFHGPGVLGGLLLVSNDPGERKAIIKEAEDALDKGCVAHNYFWFYQYALQSAVNNREWEQLQYFRDRLAAYDHSPMTKWSTFFTDRSVVLENYYRNRVTETIESQRLQLVDTCRQRGMFKSLAELEAVAS